MSEASSEIFDRQVRLVDFEFLTDLGLIVRACPNEGSQTARRGRMDSIAQYDPAVSERGMPNEEDGPCTRVS
jgi:hypothetical protein